MAQSASSLLRVFLAFVVIRSNVFMCEWWLLQSRWYSCFDAGKTRRYPLIASRIKCARRGLRCLAMRGLPSCASGSFWSTKPSPKGPDAERFVGAVVFTFYYLCSLRDLPSVFEVTDGLPRSVVNRLDELLSLVVATNGDLLQLKRVHLTPRTPRNAEHR